MLFIYRYFTSIYHFLIVWEVDPPRWSLLALTAVAIVIREDLLYYAVWIDIGGIRHIDIAPSACPKLNIAMKTP